MRMGLHKDPSHHLFTPWVAEMRRRMWTYFLVMDHPAYNYEGAESLFDHMPWTPRPINTNDNQWPAHRFLKPDQVPLDIDGLTDMTFVNIRREQLFMAREAAKLTRSTDLDKVLSIMGECDRAIRKKYIDRMCEPDSPMESVILGSYRSSNKCLRVYIEVSMMKSGVGMEETDEELHDGSVPCPLLMPKTMWKKHSAVAHSE